MSALPTLCGGFLLAVLWMDLMFDVQVLRYKGENSELPEEVLRSIAAYYRRVTTEARPMGYAIVLVMLVVITLFVVSMIRLSGIAARAASPFVARSCIHLLAR